MNTILVYLALFTVSGAGLTRAMAPVNPFEGLKVIALLQWYQSYYPNAPVPVNLLQPKQQQPVGQPQTSPPQASPSAPSAPAPAPAPAPQSQTPSAPAPQPQPQTPSAPASTPWSQSQPQTTPAPQSNPSFQPNRVPSHYPVPTGHINMHPGRGLPSMSNVDPVTQMLLMAARMKRKYRRGEPLPRMPPFFPGGWVIAADGSDANVLGKDGRAYTIDSNRICIAGRCAPVL